MGIGLLFLIVGIACIVFSCRLDRYNGDETAVISIAVVGIVFCLVIVIGSIVVPVNCVSYDTDMKFQYEQYAIYEDWRNNTLPKLIKTLSEYPPYEQRLMKEFVGKSALVNIPPNLKADKTFVGIVGEIKGAERKLLDIKINIANDKMQIERNHRIGRWFAVYAPHN